MLGAAAEGCKIPGSEVHLRALLHTEEIKGEPVVSFLPDAPVDLAEVAFEGCTLEGLNGVYPVTGSALAKMDNATGEATFKEPKVGGMLDFAGTGALFEGIMEMLMEGGGKLEVKA